MLSVLICTLPERSKMLTKLLSELNRQISDGNYSAEILTQDDPRGVTIGAKRNKLINRAIGEYTAFIDDDDFVSINYMQLIFDAFKSNPDCVGIVGRMFLNNNDLLFFHHSSKYVTYTTDKNNVLKKPAGHLNPIKRSITSKFKFIETNKSEDTDFAMRISESGIIKSEVFLEHPIYIYNYVDNKPPAGIYTPKPPNLGNKFVKKDIRIISHKKYKI